MMVMFLTAFSILIMKLTVAELHGNLRLRVLFVTTKNIANITTSCNIP